MRVGYVLGLVVTLTWGGAAPAADTARLGGVDYVSFESFCARNGLADFRKVSGTTTSSHPQAIPVFKAMDPAGGSTVDDYFQVSAPGAKFVFRVGNCQFYFNGTRHWLSFPLKKTEGGSLMISRVDGDNLVEVLLKGRAAVEGRRFEGVIIDAGHGGHNRGAVGKNGVTEKATTLSTAMELKQILEAEGVKVVMTRSSDKFIELGERSAIANNYDNHLFVSIHFNMGKSTSHGVETYAMTPQGAASMDAEGKVSKRDGARHPGNEHGAESLLLADMVHREMCTLHPPSGDRGVKWARFAVLRTTRMPSILVEGGFLSNPQEVAQIGDEGYRKKLAGSVARGVLRFMDVMATKDEPSGDIRLVEAAPDVEAPIMDGQPHEIPSAESSTRTPPHGKVLN